MKPMVVFAAILIAIGVVVLVQQGITMSLAPLLGGVALIAGVALLLVGLKRP